MIILTLVVSLFIGMLWGYQIHRLGFSKKFLSLVEAVKLPSVSNEEIEAMPIDQKTEIFQEVCEAGGEMKAYKKVMDIL